MLGRMGKAVSNTGEERLYHYDANGNVDSVTTVCDRNKQITVYTFDKDDRRQNCSRAVGCGLQL